MYTSSLNANENKLYSLPESKEGYIRSGKGPARERRELQAQRASSWAGCGHPARQANSSTLYICPFNQNSLNPSILKWTMALNKSSSDIAFGSAKESQSAQW